MIQKKKIYQWVIFSYKFHFTIFKPKTVFSRDYVHCMHCPPCNNVNCLKGEQSRIACVAATRRKDLKRYTINTHGKSAVPKTIDANRPRSVIELLTRRPQVARPNSVPSSASAPASQELSESEDEFGETAEPELTGLRDDQSGLDEPMSRSSSKSSLGSKSFKQRMIESLNSLSDKMSHLLSEKQDPTEPQDVISSNTLTAALIDLMISCRSISHITLFPFIEYDNNQFKCKTCNEYLTSTTATPKFSTIH